MTGWRLWSVEYDARGRRRLLPLVMSDPEAELKWAGLFKPPAWVNDRTVVAQCHRCSNPPAHDHGCGIYFFHDTETFWELVRGCAKSPDANRALATYGRTLGPILPDLDSDPLAAASSRCTAYEVLAVWAIAELTGGAA